MSDEHHPTTDDPDLLHGDREPATDPSGSDPATPPVDPPGWLMIQPLTLDLVDQVLDRMGLRYERRGQTTVAAWADHILTLAITQASILAIRAEVRTLQSAAELATFVGRCNEWNSTRYFMKASAIAAVGQVRNEDGPDGATRHVPAVQLKLEFEPPLAAGVAPIQLQFMLAAVRSNVQEWLEFMGKPVVLKRSTVPPPSDAASGTDPSP